MSDTGLAAAVAAMRAADIGAAAISVFEHNYRLVESGADGVVLESEIQPLDAVPTLDSLAADDDYGREVLAQTVMIKLNGGLGTSMGLDAAKTLLPVRDGLSFLDIQVRQVLAARERYGARLPLLFMNSFRTEADTRRALAAYPELGYDGIPLTFVQNQEPKLLADSLEPAQWPADPSLAWCPPGHGDLYTVLYDGGILDSLIEQGFRYASVANGDNLGAAPDPRLAGWFAASGAPIAAEACRRSANDRKGGHFARRLSDGRVVLRESAMVAPEDRATFEDENLHRYFNSNNLWLDLVQVRDALRERNGVLGLALIKNLKHLDPTDKESPRVIQLETGMGSAIETFDGTQVIEVPRSRFLPVKTTNELMLVRSDCYTLDSDYVLSAVVPKAPVVRLASEYYQRMRDYDARVPQPVSLREATSLTVAGDWTFAPDCVIVGDVELPDTGQPEVASGRLS